MAFLRWSRYARVVVVALVVTFLLSFRPLPSILARGRPFDTWSLDNYPRPQNGGADDDNCHAFRLPIAQQVQIVLKTGAADKDKLLAHLSTITSCALPSDLLIVSDLEDKIGPWQLHDVLGSIPQDYKRHNRDFDIYFMQQRWREKNLPPSDIPNYNAGWKLDKYKFLPMMDLALHERPGKKWYFFIETDTYVDWENLFFWIAHFDASKPRYMGSPVWPKNKVNFAHGGSGFVLSHTALEKLAEATHAANGTLAASMGIDLAKECCGDEILANILHKLGIKLRGYWPMFNGEKPTTISFGEEQWCEPVITLHHLNPADTKRFYLWQQQYKKISPLQQPVLFQSLYEYIRIEVLGLHLDWDNFSEDIKLDLRPQFNDPNERFDGETGWNFTTAAELCVAACIADARCLQWRVRHTDCWLGYSIRLGEEIQHTLPASEHTISGSIKERINSFVANKRCQTPHWVKPNP